MKTCKGCAQDKPLDAFYAQKASNDSRMGKCKDCWKREVKARRVANIEAVRDYDRQRATLPHRIANATRVSREWRRKHRERQNAHNAAARAGLQQPSTCEGCGNARRLEKHHHDYSRPLLVVWLCKPCHVIADKIRRRLEAV